MAGFCEVSCVKYCVFAFPLVVTTVQTHGGASSALRRIHASTRNEERTYIGASIASDVAIAIALFSQHIKEWWWTDFCGVGGWHALVLFYFVRSYWSPCLILFVVVCVVYLLLSSCLYLVAVLFAFLYLLHRLAVFSLTALCRPCLFLVCLAFPPCLVRIE